MSVRSIGLDEGLYKYLCEVSIRESDVLARLRDETSKLSMARMQISPEQGQFMGLLAELLGVRRAIEVGTFTGYSALSVALAMPADGELVACDVSAEWTAIGQRYWQEAGVADRITLKLAPALETLDGLIDAGRAGEFDFAFIDADKTNYKGYYERCLKLLRAGGLVAVDNVLWGGDVADPENQDDDTVAIRALNSFLATDERVSLSMVPIGDGLTLARKR